MSLLDNYIQLIQAAFSEGEQNPARIIGKLCQHLWEKGQKSHLNYYPHSFFVFRLLNKIENEQLDIQGVLTEFNQYQQASGAFGIRRSHDLAAILAAFLVFYPHHEDVLAPGLLSHLPPRPASLLFRYISIPDTTRMLGFTESNLLEKLIPHLSPAQLIVAKKNVIQNITQTTLTLPDDMKEASEFLDRTIKQLDQPNKKVGLLIKTIQDTLQEENERKRDFAVLKQREFCATLMQPEYFAHPTQHKEIYDVLHTFYRKTHDIVFIKTMGKFTSCNYDTLKKLCGEFKHHPGVKRGDLYLKNSDLAYKTEKSITLLLLLSDAISLAKTSPHAHIQAAAEEIEAKAISIDAQATRHSIKAQLYFLTKRTDSPDGRHDTERVSCFIISQLGPYMAKDKLEAVLSVFAMRLDDEDTHISFVLDICHALSLLVPFIPKSLMSTTLINSIIKHIEERDDEVRNAFKQIVLAQDLDQQVFYTYGVVGKKVLNPEGDDQENASLQILFFDLVSVIESRKLKPEIAKKSAEEKPASKEIDKQPSTRMVM